MRLRNVKNAEDILNNSKYVINSPATHKGSYKEIFQNNNPIHLEIGTGKGQFIINMAKKYPDINFIGVELKESVLVRAVQKLETVDLPNLRLMVWDAIALDKVFDSEINTIYLNFSDPWPKKKHEKRRLTSPLFLKTYDKVFCDKAKIIQKTDNLILFASSIVNLSNFGYKIVECSLDLASSNIDNITTEYEEKFMNEGIKINYLKAIKKNDIFILANK